jgi:glutamyl-tRNA synthetase
VAVARGVAYRGRYAPTPSGPLHLGNLRTALLAWLLARHAGGAFVLRMEDLDRPRVRPGAAAAILSDLRWLGLDWDEGPDTGGPAAPYTQSERGAIYEEHLRRLHEAGLVYPCYCSRTDIARAASAPHGAEDGPAYPGTCRDPLQREQQRRRAGGRPPALRLRVPGGMVGFQDGLYGLVEQDVARASGDVVVRRADGVPAYQLAVVVDDALMAITDVVRGADLLFSTPRQIALYHAFGYTVPRFLHVPLAVDASGERLAKRHGAVGLGPLRASGLPPEYVVGALAASVGLVPPGTALTARELLTVFDPLRLAREPAPIALPCDA